MRALKLSEEFVIMLLLFVLTGTMSCYAQEGSHVKSKAETRRLLTEVILERKNVGSSAALKPYLIGDASCGAVLSQEDYENLPSNVRELCMADDGLTVEADYAAASVKSMNVFKNKKKDQVVVTFSHQLSTDGERAYERSVRKAVASLKLNGKRSAYKARKIYGYVTSKVSYDTQNVSGNRKRNVSYTGFGASQNGKASCYGFTQLFYSMCREAGVPCRIILGDEVGNHAWNLVKIGKKWYVCDPTWDSGSASNWSYFLCGRKSYEKKTGNRPDRMYRADAFRDRFPVSASDYAA